MHSARGMRLLYTMRRGSVDSWALTTLFVNDGIDDMMDLRLHGAIWRSADDRRDAWQRALDELNDENDLRSPAWPEADLSLEVVRLPSGAFSLRLYRDVFERLEEIALDTTALREVFKEYAQTIRHMVHMHQDAPARGFESLDHAKRIVHDEAAAWMQESLAPTVELDSDDARRLFTLLFLIGGDLPEHLVRFHLYHV